MIMDWVHCNHCFLLPDREKCFFLTSCGHIFCGECVVSCAHDVCKLCGNQCTTIPLSSSMKPDVQIYFTDPDELLKAKLKEVQKIAAFQRNHRARLMAYYRKELNKYKQMKDAFKNILKNLKDLESQRKQISKENETLKKIIELSGVSRSLSATPYSAGVTSVGRKGNNITPHEYTTPNSHMNPILSHFLNKFDPTCSNATTTSERVSVFSPPVHGKMGPIPGTASPSTIMKNLKLNSGSQQNNRYDENYTPDCSQETFSTTPFSEIQSSPLDCWNVAKNIPYQHKKDPRRVVVHPYSPDD